MSYVDWGYAGKVSVTLILILLFCWWVTRMLIALTVTWDRLANEDARDRGLSDQDQMSILARVAHGIDELDEHERERFVC